MTCLRYYSMEIALQTFRRALLFYWMSNRSSISKQARLWW
jgi:hypothetical protein